MNLGSLVQSYMTGTTGLENVSDGLRPCPSRSPGVLGSRCWEGIGKQQRKAGQRLPTGAEKATLRCHQAQLVIWQQPPGSSPSHHPAPYRIYCHLVDPSGIFLSVWQYPDYAGASHPEGQRATAECGHGTWGFYGGSCV